MRTITLLGATGSIGENTLSVLTQNIDKYRIFAMSAHRNVAAMAALCQAWHPRFAVMADETAAQQLHEKLQSTGLSTVVLAGESGLIEISQHSECDIVVAGIVGAAGLAPTLAAAKSGKRILLANKEVLVMAGALFMDAVRSGGATLIPVDSEHNALWQAMPPGYRTGDVPAGVTQLILTASGGPFRD
nr:1-deoxy-D-xylulose-5-phosphate reductoisomerase [Pseudomonadota bacterium]